MGCSLSEHAFDIHEVVAPVSEIVVNCDREIAAFFILLNLTSIISSADDSHSKSDEELRLLSGVSESWGSLMSSGS